MSIKAVLFDLDCRLLKMDQDEFVKTYFKYLAIHLAPRGYEDKEYIDEFYKNGFNKVEAVCGKYKEANEIIALVKKKGKTPILATNPLFPHTATENRMRWAGLNVADFAEYTTYENCHFCKPNPKYYEELLERHNLKPEECIMVGNDVEEDMIPTEKLGMRGFLLTNCLINKRNQDTSKYPQGDFEALKVYLEELL